MDPNRAVILLQLAWRKNYAPCQLCSTVHLVYSWKNNGFCQSCDEWRQEIDRQILGTCIYCDKDVVDCDGECYYERKAFR